MLIVGDDEIEIEHERLIEVENESMIRVGS